MNILHSTTEFLDKVEHFYKVYDSGNHYKLLALDYARKELKSIKDCAICEHPARIVLIRRMLTNTLPHMGFEERSKLETDLNRILDFCREKLKQTA